MINQLCDVMERRLKTDQSLSAIDVQHWQAAVDWFAYNADPNSEVAMVSGAFIRDVDRVSDGDFESWEDAYKQSGSQYVDDCKTASWKR